MWGVEFIRDSGERERCTLKLNNSCIFIQDNQSKSGLHPSKNVTAMVGSYVEESGDLKVIK